MPPPLPDRFRLEVRLGRDGDLEEWLANDTSLDRPVLIRLLGSEASPERRAEFVRAVRSASTVSHPHLASVYAVDETADSAYSVSEWTGGATLAARLAAGDTMDPDEFLSNAAGLAGALAELHAHGVTHGDIDLSAITYTVAHPAKLGAFGRVPSDRFPLDDVRSLASTLEHALTGSPPGGPPPSESIDGLSPAVDKILRAGRTGAIDARALCEAFTSAPTPRRPQPESTRPSRRLLLVAIALVVAAAGLVGLGRLFTSEGAPSLPPPAVADDQPPADRPPAPTSTTSTTVADVATATVTVVQAATLDPFGGGGENDQLVANLIDGDSTTSWRSELYLDPLPLLKPGVGLVVEVGGEPRSLDLLGMTSGAAFDLRWAARSGSDPDDFELVARLLSQPGVTSIQLPPRTDGSWLIWFTDLPAVGADFSVSVSEIRFRP